MKNRAKTNESMQQEINSTYFVYQCGHIKGPFTVSELLGKCVRNEIHLKSEKILFCATSLTNNYYNNKHCKVWNSLEELKETGFHEKLYNNLYPLQQLNTIIHQPPIPQKTMNKTSYGLSFHQFIRILSVLLSKILFIFISLHFIIPLVLCTIIYCILFILCCSTNKVSLFSPYSLCLFL